MYLFSFVENGGGTYPNSTISFKFNKGSATCTVNTVQYLSLDNIFLLAGYPQKEFFDLMLELRPPSVQNVQENTNNSYN